MGARFRSDVMRSLQSTSQSDLARATPCSRSHLTPLSERPPKATHQSRSRPLARTHQKSALERLPGATPASRSALFCCRKSWFLKDLFAIYFGRFALGKTYVLNIFCSHQWQIIFYLLIYWEIHKNLLDFDCYVLVLLLISYLFLYMIKLKSNMGLRGIMEISE